MFADDAAPPSPPAASAPAPTTEAKPDRPNALQADLGLAVVGLAYERMFLPWLAVQVEAQIFGTWFGPTFDLPDMRGFGGQVRPTFFLTDDGPRGLYVAPFLRINAVSTEKNDATGRGAGFSSGAFIGYAFLFADRVNLRLGAGAQYMSYVVDVAGERVAFKQFFPGIDLVLGYHF